MNKLLAMVVCVGLLSGCGVTDHVGAMLTGKGSEVCQGGVVYLQFTSGVTPKYKPDGSLYTCN